MQFEWDEAKRKANLAKHQIDFFDAASMWTKDVIDPAFSRKIGEEARVVALGIIGDAEIIIAVVYTLRGSAKRLISARRARRHERRNYADRFGTGQ
jgi:uncharacterized protein